MLALNGQDLLRLPSYFELFSFKGVQYKIKLNHGVFSKVLVTPSPHKVFIKNNAKYDKLDVNIMSMC